MHSKKFESFEKAVEYMKSRGKLKYYGRVGDKHEIALYNLTINNKVYHIQLRDDGYLRVTHERYKQNDE